jgi:molybdenum-dependent DNA-binding transcriptional regulator ModE
MNATQPFVHPRNKSGHYIALNKSQRIRREIARGASIGEAARAVGVSYHHARSVVKPWRKAS